MKKNTKSLIFSITQIVSGLVILISQLIQYFDFTLYRFIQLSFSFLLIITGIMVFFQLKLDKKSEK